MLRHRLLPKSDLQRLYRQLQAHPSEQSVLPTLRFLNKDGSKIFEYTFDSSILLKKKLQTRITNKNQNKNGSIKSDTAVPYIINKIILLFFRR